MSTVKRTLVNVSFYDPEAIQRKLEQMAARGWMIQKAGNLFWTYTKIPPQKLRFAVTYFPGASEFDPKPSERQLEREELCAQDGWRLVLRWDAMQIFCTDREDAVPIDTDPVPQVDNIHRTMRKKGAGEPAAHGSFDLLVSVPAAVPAAAGPGGLPLRHQPALYHPPLADVPADDNL